MAEHGAPARRGRRGAAPPEPVEAILRAVDVLDCLTQSAGALGVSEVARRTGLSPATAYRVLFTLAERELVRYEAGDQRYHVGTRLLQYGLRSLRGLDIRRLARPHLEQLQQASAETACLCVRTGDERMYLEQVESPQEVRQALQVGLREPLYRGASGKAILAHMPPAYSEEYLARGPFPAMTAVTITASGALRAELAAIRRRGYAVSVGERWPDTASVAAPVFDHEGLPAGALILCAPGHRTPPERLVHFGRLVTAAAGALSRSLGHEPQQMRKD